MTNETAYDRVIRRLREHGSKVITGHGGQKSEAQCPSHDDHNASLSVTGIAGQALVWCHNPECDTRDVLAALDLTLADLYDEKSTLYRYDDGRTIKRWYEDGKKRFIKVAEGAETPALYRSERIKAVARGAHVFLVEGEKDVHAIEAAGGAATTAPHGAQSFHKVDVEPLRGLLVSVVVDRDGAGDKWAAQVAEKLEGVAKYRFRQAKVGKDAADHIAAGHGLTDFEPYELLGVSDEAPDTDAPRYGDVAALLADGIPDPPQPDILFRSDGYALFYRGKVNTLFGDSESGKTWIALAAMVEVLNAGGKAAVLDLDHNGMAETVTRALRLGAKPADLADPNRFRYCEPEDAHELIWFVRDIAAWAPDLAIVDSLGEVLPMLGLNSNSPDEYTKANRTVATPLARAGAACVTIDHLPKDDGAREKGQTGTLAKKRAINGVSLRVTVQEQFTPGFGGAANLTINKDRPGGLRGHCPPGKNAPAGRFVMVDNGDGMTWHITTPPSVAPKGTGPRVSDADIAAVLGLPADQRTKRKVQDHLSWGSDRAVKVLQRCRELGEYADDN